MAQLFSQKPAEKIVGPRVMREDSLLRTLIEGRRMGDRQNEENDVTELDEVGLQQVE